MRYTLLCTSLLSVLLSVAVFSNAIPMVAVSHWAYVGMNPMAMPITLQRYLRVQDAEEAPANPEPNKWWKDALDLGGKLSDYTSDLMHNISVKGEAIAGHVSSLKEEITNTISATSSLSALVQKNDATFDAVAADLSHEFALILQYLNNTFPPPSEAERHAQREQMTHETFIRVEESLVRVLSKHGIAEEDVRQHFGAVKGHLEQALVTMGDLVEQHPDLTQEVIFVVAALSVTWVAEAWFVRPFFIELLGWGPRGPVKGSVASWIQRRYWGAAVEEGSWFSHLQRAGMKGGSSAGSWVRKAWDWVRRAFGW